MRRPTTPLFVVAICALLLFSFYVHFDRQFLASSSSSSSFGGTTDPPPVAATTANLLLHRQNLAVRDDSRSGLPSLRRTRPPPPPEVAAAAAAEGVLLPEWEVLLLLPPNASMAGGGDRRLSCRFHNGAASPATFAGRVSSTPRRAYRCRMPNSVQRLRPFRTPALIVPGAGRRAASKLGHLPEMVRWNRLVYEAISTPDDIIVFAKGVNTRQGVNRRAADLKCLFFPASGNGGPIATTAATTSAQEVFRCLHPSSGDFAGGRRFWRDVRISLQVKNGPTVPSVAAYHPPRVSAHGKNHRGRSLICACTMVYNVAKFLREWVLYHARIGVDRFILYDNLSSDQLKREMDRLRSEGFDVSARFWPWPKTQEAGFSHSAAISRAECEWMVFLDVDEFIFSPDWAESDQPNPSMLRSLVAVRPKVGQVSMGCVNFGPSGHLAHPRGGVTQGYTCRRRAQERHKSLVRLDAVAEPLVNSVHHFKLRDGFRTKRHESARAKVYHYKYQAWEEFKVKFRRRVSAYVADWRDAVNPKSKDRTPGLGFEPVAPKGWAWRFCEVNDTELKEATHRWFGMEMPDGEYKMEWEL